MMNGKNVLPDIPAMGYGNPSAVCYIGSLMRLMSAIGDPVTEDEAFALSGVGLCFPWRFASSCDEVGVIPEIPARTFEAFGYASEYLTGQTLSDSASCLEKIKRSIDAGRPVIGFGITVKAPMACLIVGYDEGGLYTRSCWPPTGGNRDTDAYYYLPDWHENCAGLLVVGEKTGERLSGADAYARITDWALRFRRYNHPVKAEGQDIFVNKNAYEAMVEWLLDDDQWHNPTGDGREAYLKQCGLLLVNHYRYQLSVYLKKLDTKNPGVVNKPVFTALEGIAKATPGAHKSDLWLHEAVDPALSDFSAMRSRALREKVAAYVRLISDCDNSVQWTLFMPNFVKRRLKGFSVDSFEYREYPAMRFIGVEGGEYDDVSRRAEAMRVLDAMCDHRSGFDFDVLFMHHYGLEANHPWHGVWGRFLKSGAPVPDGYLSFDFVPRILPNAGPPYCSCFAFAVFLGDAVTLHASEGFDSDAMYDTTRNIILGDGVNIPYPNKYWTAEVFLDGCDKPGTGYLFSVDPPAVP